MAKFRLTKNTKTIIHPINKIEVVLYQIESLKDFTLINGKEIKVGDLGGYVQKEDNLSQHGLCWIYDDCCMFDKAKRSADSIGYGNSKQYGNSEQKGRSKQYGHSRQYGESEQYDDSEQYEYSQQFGSSKQYNNSKQSGNSKQYGNSIQLGISIQRSNSKQSGNFIHNYGIHLSCSNKGKLTKEKELVEFNNIGYSDRSINYDVTTKLININNCFDGNVEQFLLAFNRVYVKGDTGYDSYIRVIKMIRSLETTN